jgi:type II secretory pathway pseudopilin PulG
MNQRPGYVLIMLLFLVTAMGIGLLVAVPVWQTQMQREKEEELIFRGKQYVEAVRLFQVKKPGTFPKDLEELVKEKCLRRLFRDPMNPEGDWNIILLPQGVQGAGARSRQPGSAARRQQEREAGAEQGQSFSVQSILVAPQKALPSIRNAQIIGVVSSSTNKSFRLYNDAESYDKWLFFYGQDPKQTPEIIYYGQEAPPKDDRDREDVGDPDL